MTMKYADIILNFATVGFSGIEFTNAGWISMMFVPTCAYMAACLCLFTFVFRKELKAQDPVSPLTVSPDKPVLSVRQKALIPVIIITVALWASGINVTFAAVCAALIMVLLGFLKLPDIKAIDLNTLVFLTAAFAIGSALNNKGVAPLLFTRLSGLLPAPPQTAYLLAASGISVIIHMILGSNTTSLSVIIPALLGTSANYDPQIIMLTAFVSVAFHCVAPFHCVTMAISSAKNYFPNKYILRFGLPGIPLIFVALYLFYFPWWGV
jgi:hypothetical protein